LNKKPFQNDLIQKIFSSEIINRRQSRRTPNYMECGYMECGVKPAQAGATPLCDTRCQIIKKINTKTKEVVN
jgi:hypothetical protein